MTKLRDQIASLQNTIAAQQAKLADLKEQLPDNLDLRAMSKQERISLAMEMPSLNEGHMDILEEFGFRTGSSVYSDVTPNDIDWCVCVSPQAFKGYVVGMGDEGYWEADGFSTVYGNKDGQLYNLICFSDANMAEAWKLATEIMEAIKYSKIDFTSKWRRVRVFRALKDALMPDYNSDYFRSTYNDAIKYHHCKRCKREAINFIDKPHRTYWERTGMCNRCVERLKIDVYESLG